MTFSIRSLCLYEKNIYYKIERKDLIHLITNNKNVKNYLRCAQMPFLKAHIMLPQSIAWCNTDITLKSKAKAKCGIFFRQLSITSCVLVIICSIFHNNLHKTPSSHSRADVMIKKHCLWDTCRETELNLITFFSTTIILPISPVLNRAGAHNHMLSMCISVFVLHKLLLSFLVFTVHGDDWCQVYLSGVSSIAMRTACCPFHSTTIWQR